MKKYFAALLGLFCAGCASLPRNVETVKGFDLNRYLGTWYEVARLSHSFENGLTSVTAEYSLRPDGGVNVVNRGYSTQKKKWKTATGRAYFRGEKTTGELRVSFFRPFYGDYNIIELAGDYSYALVAGPDTSYLWILARTPELPNGTLEMLVTKARVLGFPAEELVFPGDLAPKKE